MSDANRIFTVLNFLNSRNTWSTQIIKFYYKKKKILLCQYLHVQENDRDVINKINSGYCLCFTGQTRIQNEAFSLNFSSDKKDKEDKMNRKTA